MILKNKASVSVKTSSKVKSVPVSIKMQNLILAIHQLGTLCQNIDHNQHLLKSLNLSLNKKADAPVPTIPNLKFIIIQTHPEPKMPSKMLNLSYKGLTLLQIKFKLTIKRYLILTRLLFFPNLWMKDNKLIQSVAVKIR